VKSTPVMCGDCLILLSDCVHSADYLQDLIGSAQRLIQLTKEREILEPTINDIKKAEEESADVLR
jgi:hypothetical protein